MHAWGWQVNCMETVPCAPSCSAQRMCVCHNSQQIVSPIISDFSPHHFQNCVNNVQVIHVALQAASQSHKQACQVSEGCRASVLERNDPQKDASFVAES